MSNEEQRYEPICLSEEIGKDFDAVLKDVEKMKNKDLKSLAVTILFLAEVELGRLKIEEMNLPKIVQENEK